MAKGCYGLGKDMPALEILGNKTYSRAMHHVTFLYDLALVMIVAGMVTILCHRFKQPVVLGYILAGVIIGPHTPPFPLIGDEETIQTLSELGVIFLLFSLGLEFSLRKLKQVGSTAFIAASLEILLMIWVGYKIGQVFGWGPMDSLFLGAILSISSTTIILKAFGELGKTREKFAELVFGILIVEDILAIVLIALLSGIAQTGSLQGWEAAVTVGRLSVFLVVSLVLGLIAVPRLIGFVARFKSDEMLLVTVLGLCFGFSLLAVKLGYSVALGAFLIGAIIAEAREIRKIETLMHPVRDMFSAVFFVSVGLLIEPKLLVEHAVPIAVITLAVIVGKVVTCSLGTFVAGHDIRTSTRVGMSLAQIGEFSFIIAALGLSLKVTSGFLYPIAVSVSVLTTLSTPYLVKSSDRLTAWLERKTPATLVSYLNLYSRWVEQFAMGRKNSDVRHILRRIGGQLMVFLSLIAGAILTAIFIASMIPRFYPAALPYMDIIQSGLWLIAVISALPVFIAAYRKLKALGMILAELGITDAMGGTRKMEIRAVVANSILVLGLIFLCTFTFLLSSAILPPINALLILLLAVGVLAYMLRSSFNKIYFQGKAALAETFSREHLELSPEIEAKHMETSGVMRLKAVSIGPQSPWAGKFIRESELHTRTGALIAVIERSGEKILKPDGEEEFQAGDRLLLLGDGSQLEAAQAVLSGREGVRSAVAPHIS